MFKESVAATWPLNLGGCSCRNVSAFARRRKNKKRGGVGRRESLEGQGRFDLSALTANFILRPLVEKEKRK